MTDQQPEGTIFIEEVTNAVGYRIWPLLSSVIVENLDLAKQLVSLQKYSQDLETTVVGLNDERSKLISKATADETQIHNLKTELEMLRCAKEDHKVNETP